MVGGADFGATVAVRLGLGGTVLGATPAAAHFALNGAHRETDSLGDQFIAHSQPDIVLNLVTLGFGEGWHGGISFCLRKQRVPQSLLFTPFDST